MTAVKPVATAVGTMKFALSARRWTMDRVASVVVLLVLRTSAIEQ